MRRTLTAAAAILFLGCYPVYAGSTTASVTVAKAAAPLRVITTGITADCGWPPGTVIMTMSAQGGNGNPVTYSLATGSSGDFVVSGSTVVIAPNGIAPPNCGKTENVTVNATQP